MRSGKNIEPELIERIVFQEIYSCRKSMRVVEREILFAPAVLEPGILSFVRGKANAAITMKYKLDLVYRTCPVLHLEQQSRCESPVAKDDKSPQISRLLQSRPERRQLVLR